MLIRISLGDKRLAVALSLLLGLVSQSPGRCSQTDLQRTLQNLKPATSSLSKSAFETPAERIETVSPGVGASSNFSQTMDGGTSQAINRPVTDKWALVVGVSKFADPTIPTLRYAAKDAQDFADYLIKNANFAPDHVRVLLNEQATHRQIESSLGDKYFPQVVKKDDLVVVFYSSHGSPANRDVAKINYLVAYDTQKDDLYTTGVDADALTRQLRERLNAERVLIILDACHSGGAADGAKDGATGANFDVLQVPLGAGQMLITSSSADERSWESKRYKNGIFTHHLLQSMDKNGKASPVSTIFQDLQSGVEDEVRQDEAVTQTPKFRNDRWTGNDLILAVVPSNPHPLPVTVKKWFDTQTASSKLGSHASLATESAAHSTATTHSTPVASVAKIPAAPVSAPTAAPVVANAVTSVVSSAAPSSSSSAAFVPLSSDPAGFPNQNFQPQGHGGNDLASIVSSVNNMNTYGSGNSPSNNFQSTQTTQSTQSSTYKGGKFAPGDGCFSVMMPPPMIDESGPKHHYQARAGSTTFEVNVIELPGANQMLVGFADGFLKAKFAQGYTHSAGRARMVNGYPGLEFTYGNAMQKCGVVFCATERRMMTFNAAVGAFDNFNRLMPFFSSISIH